MIYGVDSAYPPPLVTARYYASLGWRVYGGYLGGPRAYHKWQLSDFQRLRDAGFLFELWYVGRNVGPDASRPWDAARLFTFEQGVADADEANTLAGACGFDESAPLSLDVEYGTWQAMGQRALDYADGWCQRVHDAGHQTIGYMDQAAATVLGSHFDYVHVADYVANRYHYTRPPAGSYDPTSPPAWDAWQFADNAIGGAVDANSYRDGFPFAVCRL